MPRSFDLGPRFETLIDDLVASGRFPNAEAVMSEALRLLDLQETERVAKIAVLRALIKDGDESGDAGDWDVEKFLAEAKALGAERRAAAE